MGNIIFSCALKQEHHWNFFACCYEKNRVIGNYTSRECTRNEFVMDSYIANNQKSEFISMLV
jgi:hypothetical protein